MTHREISWLRTFSFIQVFSEMEMPRRLLSACLFQISCLRYGDHHQQLSKSKVLSPVTISEQAWLHEAAESDQILGRALAEGTLSVASTGTGNCVIDLAQVRP